MNTKPGPWHYPRTSDAVFFMTQFRQGLPALTLYAPRGKGVSDFLRYDLASQAEKMGFVPIYVSLWATSDVPSLALCEALRASYTPQTFWGKFRTYFNGDAVKSDFEVSKDGPKFKTEINHVPTKIIPNEANALIGNALDTAYKKNGNKPVLLIIDQAQTLIGHAGYDVFARALRTALETRREKVHTVFAGSSRVRLAKMFRPLSAPLHNFAQPFAFTDMPEAYLTHVQKHLADSHKLQVAYVDLDRVFSILGKHPGYLQRALRTSVMNVQRGLPANLETNAVNLMAEMAEQSGMRERYLELSSEDRYVLLMVAFKTPSHAIADKLSQRGINVAHSEVLRSLARLSDLQIIFHMAKNEYEIEDMSFSQWLENDMAAEMGFIGPNNLERKTAKVLQRIDIDANVINNMTVAGRAIQSYFNSMEFHDFFNAHGLEFGAMNGGCQIVADAITRWSHGDAQNAYMYDTKTGVIQHVVARAEAFYFDADGICFESEMLKKMLFIERCDCYLDDVLPDQSGDFNEIPVQPLVSQELAAMLANRFGEFRHFMNDVYVPQPVRDAPVAMESMMPHRKEKRALNALGVAGAQSFGSTNFL